MCVWGNLEEGFGGALKNRAEVPSTFEMRTILALGQMRKRGIGSLDVKTAFLYAELIEEEGELSWCFRLPSWSGWDWSSPE